ncbi:MAG TPA: hypothetical protein VJ890_06830 [Vineibacter sp.]|nr:hypothetical protein [Vineibacter sp.]
MAALKKQLTHLAASIENTAKAEGGDAVRAIGDRAREFLSQATSFVDGIRHDARDLATDATRSAASAVQSGVHEGAERLEDAIRQRPLTAVAIAVGVGCLLSMMLRHR